MSYKRLTIADLDYRALLMAIGPHIPEDTKSPAYSAMLALWNELVTKPANSAVLAKQNDEDRQDADLLRSAEKLAKERQSVHRRELQSRIANLASFKADRSRFFAAALDRAIARGQLREVQPGVYALVTKSV